MHEELGAHVPSSLNINTNQQDFVLYKLVENIPASHSPPRTQFEVLTELLVQIEVLIKLLISKEVKVTARVS